MARRREFDVDDVLQKAMAVFWKRGYAATSMSDIYEATGLKPGSLYAAFTDKEQLFRRAFERYSERFRSTLPRELDGLAAIRRWLEVQARLAIEDPTRSGCLIVSTVTERHAHSAATLAVAEQRLAEIRAYFAFHLAKAVELGEIADDGDMEARADALLGAVVSIMTLGRSGADRTVIDNIARLSGTFLKTT